ncbi:MAG: type III-B CRISPR-associated protein Cas10/Cmr2 [Bacillota bacterium]
MNRYLFLYTITPVQNFIAQARKTRDLFAGSQLLSELIQTAIQAIITCDYVSKQEIVFPTHAIEESTTRACPNRLLAIITTPKPEQLARAVDRAVQERLQQIAIQTLQQALNSTDIPPAAREQIDQLLQNYWAITPYSGNTADYGAAHDSVENLLAEIKSIRGFKQLTPVPPHRENASSCNTLLGSRLCMLCAERPALFYRPGHHGKIPAHIAAAARAIASEIQYLFNPGESLCAICTIKRLYNYRQVSFPSTAEIALMKLLQQLQHDYPGKELLNNFRRQVETHLNSPAEFDYQLLYSENLTPGYAHKYHSGLLDQKNKIKPEISTAYQMLIKHIKEKQKQFGNHQNTCPVQPFPLWKREKYYALVMFDGDSMGDWLSGEKLKTPGPRLEFHKQLSRILGEFAAHTVPTSFDGWHNNATKPVGQLVYTGGDDFLGFFPLADFLPVLDNLRQQFIQDVNQGLQPYLPDCDTRLTFSAGVVIAHYKMPLQDVLKQARTTEKLAKKVVGKNALALCVLKHSGETLQTVLKWDTGLDNNPQQHTIPAVLVQIAAAMARGDFSISFIRKLLVEWQTLLDNRGQIPELENRLLLNSPEEEPDPIWPFLQSQLYRLLHRSCHIRPAEVKKHAVQNMLLLLQKLYQHSSQAIIQTTKKNPLNNFLAALAIIHFLLREGEDSAT